MFLARTPVQQHVGRKTARRGSVDEFAGAALVVVGIRLRHVSDASGVTRTAGDSRLAAEPPGSLEITRSLWPAEITGNSAAQILRLSAWKANSSSSTLAEKPRAVSGFAGRAVTREPPGSLTSRTLISAASSQSSFSAYSKAA